MKYLVNIKNKKIFNGRIPRYEDLKTNVLIEYTFDGTISEILFDVEDYNLKNFEIIISGKMVSRPEYILMTINNLDNYVHYFSQGIRSSNNSITSLSLIDEERKMLGRLGSYIGSISTEIILDNIENLVTWYSKNFSYDSSSVGYLDFWSGYCNLKEGIRKIKIYSENGTPFARGTNIKILKKK